jgi:hypothetical protein
MGGNTAMKYKAFFDRDFSLSFDSKPLEAIRDMLKRYGFRWSPAAGRWWRRGCKGAADFCAALDRALNPGRPDGACWHCQSPEGFFRPQGAATPVYCDACWERLNKPQADPMGVDLAFEDSCREACGL